MKACKQKRKELSEKKQGIEGLKEHMIKDP
jgi:hypothetical protein